MSISQIKQNQLDLKKVKPIEQNRLIVFINNFLDTTVSQCNELIYTIDSRLDRVNRKLNICETNLLILESKLNSIPGVASVTSDFVPSSSPPQTLQHSERATSEAQDPPPLSTPVLTTEPNSPDAETKPESEAQDDPNAELVAKYRKMLKVGVLLPAVQQKMRSEGLDPSLLNA